MTTPAPSSLPRPRVALRAGDGCPLCPGPTAMRCAICDGLGEVPATRHGWTLGGGTLSPPAPAPRTGMTRGTFCDCLVDNETIGMSPKGLLYRQVGRASDLWARSDCKTCGGSGKVEASPGVEPAPRPLTAEEARDVTAYLSERHGEPEQPIPIDRTPALTLAEVHALAERLWRERNPSGRVVVDRNATWTLLFFELGQARFDDFASLEPTEQQIEDVVDGAWQAVSDQIARGVGPMSEVADRIEAHLRQEYLRTRHVWVDVGAPWLRGYLEPGETITDGNEEAALRELAARGLLVAYAQRSCPEGHTIWAGLESSLPRGADSCAYCDDETEIDEEDISDRVHFRLSDAWRARLEGELPFAPIHYQRAKRAAEGVAIVESIIGALVKTLALAGRPS